MSRIDESRGVTGIRDANYHALWYAEHCLLLLQNHLAAAEREHQRPVA